MARVQTWMLFALALAYAAAVSLYVGYGMPATVTGTPTEARSAIMFGALTFGTLLASGFGFAVMVGFLDLLTQRRQEFLAALALGLAVFATYEAVLQIGFERALTYYKNSPTPGENSATSGDIEQH